MPADRAFPLPVGGTDTVISAVEFVLPDFLENLRLSGADDLAGFGNAGANRIEGNAGRNVLSGLGGADELSGGLGNDTLYGGDGVDTLAGASGDDTLSGGEGADTLSGEFGDDWIIGGAGRDILRGGAGEDVFVFLAVSDSVGATRDRIVDFEAGVDRIDLRGIDAGGGGPLALSLVGPGTVFSAVGQIRVTVQADTTRVDVTVDDDAEAELSILLAGALALDGATFFL